LGDAIFCQNYSLCHTICIFDSERHSKNELIPDDKGFIDAGMSDKKETQNVLDLKPIQRKGGRLAQSRMAQFTPDEELLQSTSRIKNQRDIILERIHRMETANDRVSSPVFEKVKRDYTLQLDTINELLNEKKQILKDEIRKLYMIREKLTVEVNRHREILEEADFRHYLGEFTQTQYQEVENFETKEIEKAEADLTHVNQWIRTHEELFDPEDFAKKQQTQPTPPNTRSAVQQQPARPSSQDHTKTAYRTPTEPAQSFAKHDSNKQQPASASLASAPKDDYAHLFEDVDMPSEANHPDLDSEKLKNPNLDELIEDVKSSTRASVAPATPEPQDSSSKKTQDSANHGDSDYFANQDVNEPSFKIQSTEWQNLEKANAGDSVTMARTAVKQPQNAAKEDSISDILESIRLEGEDGLVDTNSSLPQQHVNTEYKLKLIEGDLDIKEYPLKTNTSIGRSPSNDVVLKEPKVSRQHAAINLYNDNYIVVDLKSSNGVYVNGTKVDESVLHAGDEISVGGYKFIFMKND